MKTSYRERDYTYGSAMLTLRAAIGLTQKDLADLLGVSRRAVGEWEAGSSYPKVEHLKQMIALGVEQQAFSIGNETQEIHALWKAAHQKVQLDEHWLFALLSQQRSLQRQVAGQAQADRDLRTTDPDLWREAHRLQQRIGFAPVRAQPMHAPTARVLEIMSGAPVVARPESGLHVDWDDALAVPSFYGREKELALLYQWIVQEDCRVVSVLGMGGIGKSALSVCSMYQLAEQFEVVIFRSLRDVPSCAALLDECLQVFSAQSLGQAQEGEAVRTVPCAVGCSGEQAQGAVSTERRISLLLEHLRKTRTLVVLDNLEGLVQEGDVRGHLRPGFEGYGQLLCRVAETGHQSCVLLTSREKPAELRVLSGKHASVRSLRLMGLDTAACKQLLLEKGLVGTEGEQESLIEVYGGNPLALKMVAETITDLFGGVIGEFLTEGGTLVFGSITDLLSEQFARLSALEQSVLRWLAIVREPATLDELLAMMAIPLPRIQMLEAVDAGYRRSLIEPGKRPGSFTLQSVMLEYVTTVLIAEATSEIQQCRLNRLIEHGLERASAKEYVRQTQERLLLSPLLTGLQGAYRKRDELEEQLLGLLDRLREGAASAQSYGSANLIALLRLLRGHLNGLDLSRLSIRGAYLQGIEMQDANLSGSLVCDVLFTEDICSTCAVAISPDGKWWAASGMQGKIRIWKEGGRTLHLIWQTHADLVQSLVFSPDGRTLASGSLDGTIKLWDVEACSHGTSPHDALLWTGWQNSPRSLAFSPDSRVLASAGLDATVQLWDPQSGTNLQTLKHSGQVFAVAFSPDGCLLASSCSDGVLRLWERQEAEPSTCAEILSLRTSWVTSPATCLAFAPDGRTLVSVNWDQTIRLWEVSNSHPSFTTLPGQTNQARCIAWSPDGRTLAGSSDDKTIWLWDVEQGRYRAALYGHTADINDMAFTPDSRSLLSGSADNTLRMWDVQSGQCVRVIAGYAVSLYDLDWSPDGVHLVSGSSDGRVTIWDLSGQTPPRELRGHGRIVRGVGWSPDGTRLASCGWDAVLRLWDPTSGMCIQMFEDSCTALEGVAWSPDGSLLACGNSQRGMQVWDVSARSLRWTGETHRSAFGDVDVAWSPDGTRLVSGGDDGSVCLWDSTDGTLLERLPGHHSKVTSVRWSPDGTRIASAGGDGEFFVWDMQNGERVQTFAGHPDVVSALAWCSSGDQLISGDTDGKLRWWDVQSGECVSTQAAHQGTIRSLRISPDGKRLASCGDDGAIMVWDLESHGHLQTLRRDRPYERLNITGIRGLTEAQKAMLRTLGAIEETAQSVK